MEAALIKGWAAFSTLVLGWFSWDRYKMVRDIDDLKTHKADTDAAYGSLKEDMKELKELLHQVHDKVSDSRERVAWLEGQAKGGQS